MSWPCALLCWLAAVAPDPAELSRLEGHEVVIDRSAPGGYRIVDIAGEGPPLVGVIERRGEALFLVAGAEALRLTGPLAVPRIAGPGYKVWAIGDRAGDRLAVRRLGILRPPERP